jgi:hypothetical protein
MSPKRSRGGRWLQRLITVMFVTAAIACILAAIFEVVTFPLWFRGDLQPLINATVELVPQGEGVEALFPAEGTASFVESAFIDDLHARVNISSVSRWWSWLFTLLAPVSLGLTLWILWLLDHVVAGIVSGSAFTEENAVRLRTIGLLVVIESLASPALEFLASTWIGRQVEVAGASVIAAFPVPSLSAFLMGWLVVIVGEAFRHGAAMREEQELTV